MREQGTPPGGREMKRKEGGEGSAGGFNVKSIKSQTS